MNSIWYAIEGDCSYSAIYINKDRAGSLGINDGDIVEIECVGPTRQTDSCVCNEAVIGNKEKGRIKVTEALHPKAAWVYFAAGQKSSLILPKARKGISMNWLVPASVSPYAAGLGKNYSIVKIRRLVD